MNVQVIERNNLEIAVIDTGNITLRSQESALNLLSQVRSQTRSKHFVLFESLLSKDLYPLINIYADEAQQMVARQGFRVAVVGSFVGLGANTLRIFDYERNPDSAIFLAKSEEEAIERLSS